MWLLASNRVSTQVCMGLSMICGKTKMNFCNPTRTASLKQLKLRASAPLSASTELTLKLHMPAICDMRTASNLAAVRACYTCSRAGATSVTLWAFTLNLWELSNSCCLLRHSSTRALVRASADTKSKVSIRHCLQGVHPLCHTTLYKWQYLKAGVVTWQGCYDEQY